MSPSCYQNNCNTWGYTKAIDGTTAGLSSLAHTEFGTNPYIQLDMGAVRTDIAAIKLVSRTDCCLNRAINMYVYVSTTSTNFAQPQNLCIGPLSASSLGQTFTGTCERDVSGQYVTILLNATGLSLNLQEITVLADGEWGLRQEVLNLATYAIMWSCSAPNFSTMVGSVLHFILTKPFNIGGWLPVSFAPWLQGTGSGMGTIPGA
jgi:hypothetical protein